MNEENRKQRIEYLHKCKAMLPSKPICIEIGVHKGKFSTLVLDVLNPKELHLVDPWNPGKDKNDNRGNYSSGLRTVYSNNNDYIQVAEQFQKNIEDGQVKIHRMYSYDAVVNYPDNFFDFIYIDATHLYKPVMQDIEMYLPKLKQNGLLCGHDYIKCWDEVVRAVDDSVKLHNLNFEFHSPYGDWALTRKNTS